MGTDGPALFSDDTASDVRGMYREFVGDGLSGPDATDRLMREWGDLLVDPDEGPVFWLALASTQWKVGRLEPRVLSKALEVMDSGADLRRWQHDRKLLAKRTKVLADLRSQLESPQPAQKRIAKRFRDFTEWGIGEVIGYRLPSGALALMRVIGYSNGTSGSPMFELLDWEGMEPPGKLRMRFLHVRAASHGSGRFVVSRTSEKKLPASRIERLGVTLKPSQVATTPFLWVLWENLDSSLESWFGLR